MIQIVPAILAKTEEEFEAELRKIESSGEFGNGWVHIDLIDNRFAPNLTIGPDVLKKIPVNFKKEIHLMVEEPGRWVDELRVIEAERVIAHIETGRKEVEEFLKKFDDLSLAGLALNPETSPEELSGFKMKNVLVMGVHPGFQGQNFIEAEADKIGKVKDDFGVFVGVDGGISVSNAGELRKAGADYLVIGSHLISGDINENYKAIKEAIEG